MKLDAKTIAGLKLPDSKPDAIHFDDSLPGFGLRVRASGDEVRRSWIVQYRRAGRHATDAAGFCRGSDCRSGAGGSEENSCGHCFGARPPG